MYPLQESRRTEDSRSLRRTQCPPPSHPCSRHRATSGECFVFFFSFLKNTLWAPRCVHFRGAQFCLPEREGHACTFLEEHEKEKIFVASTSDTKRSRTRESTFFSTSFNDCGAAFFPEKRLPYYSSPCSDFIQTRLHLYALYSLSLFLLLFVFLLFFSLFTSTSLICLLARRSRHLEETCSRSFSILLSFKFNSVLETHPFNPLRVLQFSSTIAGLVLDRGEICFERSRLFASFLSLRSRGWTYSLESDERGPFSLFFFTFCLRVYFHGGFLNACLFLRLGKVLKFLDSRLEDLKIGDSFLFFFPFHR